ncbi:MAG: transglycosylase domain-containing protein, partial [Chloroflexi bacterium]|nr:transglycosylase domain-containing protein [Chloroflexota bacterium]
MSNVIGLVRKRSAHRAAAHSGVRRSVRVAFAALLAALAGIVIIVLAAVIIVLQLYAGYAQELPSAAKLSSAFQSSNNEFFLTTQLYDRTGKHLLYKVIDPRAGDRQWLNIEWIPPELQQATIAIEDRSFLENPGYDIFGILRALLGNLRRPQCILEPEACAGFIQGGSTITQQLVKNVILSPNALAESTYKRKFRELLIAAEAANRFSKSQILEWYLNTNFYGNLAYGVDAAARVYFGKSAVALNLAESALLAAVPQYPGLNPIDA